MGGDLSLETEERKNASLATRVGRTCQARALSHSHSTSPFIGLISPVLVLVYRATVLLQLVSAS